MLLTDCRVFRIWNPRMACGRFAYSSCNVVPGVLSLPQNTSLAMRHLLVFFAVLSAASAFAQDLHRDLSAFTGLSINAGIKTTAVQADRYAVDITGDAEALKHLKIEVKGNTLSLGYEDGAWKNINNRAMNSVRATVYVPTLASVMVNGGAHVDSEDTWKGGALQITGNGGGQVDLKIAVATAVVTVNGGAHLNLSGTAGSVEANANGGGHVRAADLVAQSVRATANGGGQIWVQASDAITASANGGGQVVYSGSAAKVSSTTNGGGRVSKA